MLFGLKEVSVDWDDTNILEAEPGDFITIAGKKMGGCFMVRRRYNGLPSRIAAA